MTNTELIQAIRNEIERRVTDNTFGAKLELIDILAWLDTLESENPIIQNEDFEKEIADYWTTMGWSKVMTLAKFKVVARYFYGLGLGMNDNSEKPMNPDDAMKELDEKIALVKQRGTWDGVDVDKYMDEVRGREPEMPMNQEDIDTEIGHWIDRLDDKYCLLVPHYSIQDIKDTARHFAQWQKEQMLKEAVEGKIYGYGDGSYELVASWLDLPKGGIYKDGQKVRVIVCKKED